MGPSPDATPLPKPRAAEQQSTPVYIQPVVTFPENGQYIVFVDFQPSGGNKMTLVLPVDVGSAQTKPAVLPAGESLTQPSGDLMMTLKHDGILKAGQPITFTFDAIDAQGNLVSGEINMSSGSHLTLYVIDEGLTTFLMPELIDPNALKFSATFPNPGKYKVWFEFRYAGKLQQLSYVLDVK